MFSKPPIITDMGMTLLLRAAGGEKITFTKFQAGNGILDEGAKIEEQTALKHVVLSNIPITKAQDTEQRGYVQLEGSFNNQTDIVTDFRWTELGLIAEDEGGNEYLYAYGYDNEYAELINAGSGAVILEQHINAIIAIGESENITAYVIPNATYASRQEFLDHLADENNPHNVSASQIGAAEESHVHSAEDVTAGVFPIARGGTGVNTLEALKALIGSEYTIGTFAGDNRIRRRIVLGFQPQSVIIFKTAVLNQADTTPRIWCFSVGKNIYHNGCPSECASCSADELFSRGHGGAAVVENGFEVGFYTEGNVMYLNKAGVTYAFIAGNIGSFT